jgi:hypothetical protein
MNKANPPASHKEWACYLRDSMGGKCAVTAYLDDLGTNKTHIFTSVNSEGIVASTVGISDIDQSGVHGLGLYTEIIMHKRGADDRVANVLSTIAFYLPKDGWRARPGVVFESMVEMYFPETKLPHVMFTAPFQWDHMTKVSLSEKVVYPLIAIPVSEGESRFAASNDGHDLEKLWEERSVDVLDWDRPGAI